MVDRLKFVCYNSNNISTFLVEVEISENVDKLKDTVWATEFKQFEAAQLHRWKASIPLQSPSDFSEKADIVIRDMKLDSDAVLSDLFETLGEDYIHLVMKAPPGELSSPNIALS